MWPIPLINSFVAKVPLFEINKSSSLAFLALNTRVNVYPLLNLIALLVIEPTTPPINLLVFGTEALT